MFVQICEPARFGIVSVFSIILQTQNKCHYIANVWFILFSSDFQLPKNNILPRGLVLRLHRVERAHNLDN